MFDERSELLDVYRATPQTLGVLIGDVDSDTARWRPAEGEWSIVEIVAHLGDAEERMLARVRRMLSEDEPQLAAFDQEALAIERDYQAMDLMAAYRRFVELRSEHIDVMTGLDPADWDRTGMHEETGRISIHQITAHMAAHDSIHLAQISRLLTSES